MSAFTKAERTFVSSQPALDLSTLTSCSSIVDKLERAIRNGRYKEVESTLACLLNAAVQPETLPNLCRSDLGALVAQIHRMPELTPHSSFPVRLSTLLVGFCAELLKVVALQTEDHKPLPPPPVDIAGKHVPFGWRSTRSTRASRAF